MLDVKTMSPEEATKIIILYRAVLTYRCSTVQSTVRFLYKRVRTSNLGLLLGELKQATQWWSKLDQKTRQRLEIEYKFAAKIR